MSNFKRENRYIVIKRKDLDCLDIDHQAMLQFICSKIDATRASQGKGHIKAVVVEHDWPEYETTWKAIEDRVANDSQDKKIDSYRQTFGYSDEHLQKIYKDGRASRDAEIESFKTDAARWNKFISFTYKVRMEYVCNLSLVPVLTQWVDADIAAEEKLSDT